MIFLLCSAVRVMGGGVDCGPVLKFISEGSGRGERTHGDVGGWSGGCRHGYGGA